MPQLRSGVRRGRRGTAVNKREPSVPEQKNKNVRNNNNNNRRAAAPAKRAVRNTRQRRTGGRNIKKEEAADEQPVGVGVGVGVGAFAVGDEGGENAVKETASVEREGAEEKRELVNLNLQEEVGEKEIMDEYDSGGRSGDKGLGAEDEGSTAPLPEKVLTLFLELLLLTAFLFFWLNFCWLLLRAGF